MTLGQLNSPSSSFAADVPELGSLSYTPVLFLGLSQGAMTVATNYFGLQHFNQQEPMCWAMQEAFGEQKITGIMGMSRKSKS